MLKPGRIVALAFVFIAACALTLSAQEKTKKQETGKELKQKIIGGEAARTEHWQPGDPAGTIEKGDAEKKTITIKEGEDGPLHTVTIDQHVTVRSLNGDLVSGFDEKQLYVGAFVGWKPDRKGNIVQLFVGTQPRFGARVPATAGTLKKLGSTEGKSKDQ